MANKKAIGKMGKKTPSVRRPSPNKRKKRRDHQMRALAISDIQKPPYNAVLVVRSHVEEIAYRLQKSHGVKPVMIADLDGTYYPTGNLEVLEAYRLVAKDDLRKGQPVEVDCCVVCVDDIQQ